MSDEVGGGNALLRERLELLIRDVRMMYHSTPRREFADAILAEIADAGYVLMGRGRAERLIETAQYWHERDASMEAGTYWQPGDLDSLPVEGER